MKFKKVLSLFVVLLILLLLSEIGGIANYNPHENLIKDEDRRGADSYRLDEHAKPEGYKRGLYEASGSHNRHQTYTPEAETGYGEAATFTSPGYSYGPQSHSVAQYYPTYSTGQGSYGSFGQSDHGVSYGYGQPSPSHGQSGHGVSYGYGHTAPAHGHGHTAPAHGHGHGGHHPLALKGLLIPLAGIALLGAAAALSTNPVLLQLGVVNGRRRRRRSLDSNIYQHLH